MNGDERQEAAAGYHHVPPRDPTLDFTKGMLVLCMIVYHWLNYFVETEDAIYSYLRFIPPSFIFITGFLITRIYPEKYGVSGSGVYRRLVIRGLKLLMLFTLLNLGANAVFASSYKGAMPGIGGFVGAAPSVYVSGQAQAAFWVLVPIGYLLIVAACLFLASRVYRHSVTVIAVGGLVLGWMLDLAGQGIPMLTFIAVGLLGMLLGLASGDRIRQAAEHASATLGAYAAYLLAITVWGVNYGLQLIGVCLSVVLIYAVGLKTADWEGTTSPIVLLGKYSLFGYIAQIGVLQALHRGLPRLGLAPWEATTVSFMGAVLLTVATVRLLDWGRGQSWVVDRLYRATFA